MGWKDELHRFFLKKGISKVTLVGDSSAEEGTVIHFVFNKKNHVLIRKNSSRSEVFNEELLNRADVLIVSGRSTYRRFDTVNHHFDLILVHDFNQKILTTIGNRADSIRKIRYTDFVELH
jgi:hypothetical protein